MKWSVEQPRMGTTSNGVIGDTRHLAHDWSGEAPISETIVAAVADAEDESRAALPSLEAGINPEALDDLFDAEGDHLHTGCVTFSYYGYTVVVRSTGQVLLRER